MDNVDKEQVTEAKNGIYEFILKQFEIGDEQEAKKISGELEQYIANSRRKESSFENDVLQLISTLSELQYSLNDIIAIISKTPSILHLNKNDIFWRYLLFEKIIDTKSGKSIRESLIIEKPEYFRTSQQTLYARIKHLESDAGMAYRRNKDFITVRQVIKASNQEFETSYRISKEQLEKKYPFDTNAMQDIIQWPKNKELLDSIFKKGVSK